MNGKTTINEEVFVELAKTAMTKVEGVFPETDAKTSLASFAKLLAERFIPQIIVRKTDADPATDTKGSVGFEMRLSCYTAPISRKQSTKCAMPLKKK